MEETVAVTCHHHADREVSMVLVKRQRGRRRCNVHIEVVLG